MIHPTAIIHAKVRIDATTEVGPYAVIDEHVKIGPGCRIGPHAHLTGHLEMGEGNVVHAGAVLGDLPQDYGFKPCQSFVRIGKNNRFREHVTVHRGTKPDSETVIGDDCFLMAGSHVAHNARLGNGVVLVNGALVAGYVEIQDRAFVSGGVLLHQFIRIGRLAMLRGGSAYSMDVPPFCNGAGENRIVGLNVVGMRRAGLGASARNALKQAFRALFLSGKPPVEAIASFDGARTPEVDELFEFVRSAKRGVCPARGIGEGEDESQE